MTSINIKNPFKTPVFHKETVTSTMDISRQLAIDGALHGSVIVADYQEAGRGRRRDRTWEMESKKNLPFTILLRYPGIEDIPAALTLRAGLAVSYAIEDFAPSLKNMVTVKWPNDIIIDAKKAAGILCEANGGDVHLGIGVNVAQLEFPDYLREKATSIALVMNKEKMSDEERFILLEMILRRLYDEFATEAGESWKQRLEQRLYKKGAQVVFIEGAAGSGKEIKGQLSGIGSGGELLITPDGLKETAFITGELVVY